MVFPTTSSEDPKEETLDLLEGWFTLHHTVLALPSSDMRSHLLFFIEDGLHCASICDIDRMHHILFFLIHRVNQAKNTSTLPKEAGDITFLLDRLFAALRVQWHYLKR